MNNLIINKNSSNVNNTSTSDRRLGEYHGNQYYMAPRLHRELKWVLRFNSLTYKEITLIESMFGFLGDNGLYPSCGTIAKEFGISATEVSKLLNIMGGEAKDSKPLRCPMCNYISKVFSIERRFRDKEQQSNLYSFEPYLNFLQHLKEEHTEDEIEDARKHYMSTHKYGRNEF